MAKEFGLQPSQSTTALYEQIRAGSLEDSSAEVPGQRPRTDSSRDDLMQDLRRQLDQVQASLDAIHGLVLTASSPSLRRAVSGRPNGSSRSSLA